MRILVCGMPRSMTTWAFNVVRELIESPQPQNMWIDGGSPQELEFASSRETILAKCHHYSPLLADASAVVIYSYRDLRTAAVSAYRKFGSPGSREQLEVWVEAQRLWLPVAHAVLRYEAIERDPLGGVAALRTVLTQRAEAGVRIRSASDAQILERVDASFRSEPQPSEGGYDAATLILPGHRTFQPEPRALPAEEKAIYDRVEAEFRGWLEEHGYVGDARNVPEHPIRPAPPRHENNERLAAYIGALIRETHSKETALLESHRAASAAIAQMRAAISRTTDENQRANDSIGRLAAELEAQRAALTRDLEAKERVITDLRAAVTAYKATFSVFGFLIWPLHWVILTTRGAWRRLRNLVVPRLGVLKQHPPVELALPAHYSRAIALSSPPRISIMTPSFRQAAFIGRTIASVLDQQYPNLEYVVQDGGSEDGTREILESFSERLASWESRPDSGQTEAINRGFARTSGEIMAWLNSDDILLPGALAYVADHFMRHPEVDVVYGHRILIDENDRQIGRWIMPPHSDAVLSWADFVPQETMFFRRRIWDMAGGCVDESVRFAMDWDLLRRFREAGARFERLPRFIGGFRIHPQQKTSAAISDVGFQEMNRLRQRVLGRIPSGIEVRKAVLPYLLKHVATDLGWAIQNKLGVRA